MAATARQEKDMVRKMNQLKDTPGLTALERMRAHVLARGVASLKFLVQTFKSLDTDKSGRLDIDEFRLGLRNEGIYMDKDIERECFNEVDTDHSGEISLDEFIVALRPAMSKSRVNLIRQAFKKLDKDGSGDLTIDDLKGVYNVKKHPKYMSGEQSEDQLLANWLSSFNGPGRSFSGLINYEDFENYYAGVSASIDSDTYFDLMMRQAWKL